MAPPGANFTSLSSASLGFTSKACFFADKLKDQSISLNSVRFCNISLRPGDHAPFLETHGNSVRLGRSGLGGGGVRVRQIAKGRVGTGDADHGGVACVCVCRVPDRCR